MQKKSFFIKDILQKLNEDDTLKRSTNQQNSSKLSNKTDNLEKSLKEMPTFDSNRLIYDWHSFAMAAMSHNALINSKNLFNWNKFSSIFNPVKINSIQDDYLNDQSKLKAYLPFNCSLVPITTSSDCPKKQLNYLIDEIEISENSNLSLCESSDRESNVDVRSEAASSLISIENTEEDESFIATIKNNGQDRSALELRKAERKKRKNRRNRTVFTELQLMGLERRFDSHKYLSTPDRAELANALGLSQLQVKTWYQNRRMKWKKHVMQGGCLVAPTKPKGRPKKGTIPSLGLTFDISSLAAVDVRKNFLAKDLNPKLSNEVTNYDTSGRKTNTNQTNLVNDDMNSIINKDLASCNPQTMSSLNESINQQQFFNKKYKLTF